MTTWEIVGRGLATLILIVIGLGALIVVARAADIPFDRASAFGMAWYVAIVVVGEAVKYVWQVGS